MFVKSLKFEPNQLAKCALCFLCMILQTHTNCIYKFANSKRTIERSHFKFVAVFTQTVSFTKGNDFLASNELYCQQNCTARDKFSCLEHVFSLVVSLFCSFSFKVCEHRFHYAKALSPQTSWSPTHSQPNKKWPSHPSCTC